ncbi:MAG: class II aldolase/adducin family protein [Bdellovibrionales bacterium]|nr:class II aldolase/adducin family protein [Bdellovibrionales bacterium]
MSLHVEEVARLSIVEIGRRLHARNFIASADGNVSLRMSDDRILITPSGAHKGFLNPADLATIDVENRVLTGVPSSERLLHLAIYEACPEARAVVHAHPPFAIAWSIARPNLKELPGNCLPEIILGTGRIPVVPYAPPTAASLGESLLPYLPESRVMVLARHGAVSWGESLSEAYAGIERLEHSCQILTAACVLGGPTDLAPDELELLRGMRARAGRRAS